MSNTTIRIAVPEDAPGIAHVQHIGWLTAYPNEELGITTKDILVRDMESERRINRHRELILARDESTQSWVAVDNENIIGWCVVSKKDERNEVNALYVLPEYHGKGVAHSLLATALQWLDHGKATWLEVVSYNSRAIRFYQKFGFILGEPVPNQRSPFPSGRNMPSREMIRSPE